MQKTPDVVISDIGMAEEDGYELIRKLRLFPVQGSLLPGFPDSLPGLIPAIALTGYATIKTATAPWRPAINCILPNPLSQTNWWPQSRNLIRGRR